MPITEEQQQLIERIDLKAKALINEGCSESGLMIELWDFIAVTKKLLNESQFEDLDEIYSHYAGFQQFTQALKQIEPDEVEE